MPLSRLPASFGFTELKKGFFPHLFNTPENQNFIGPLPNFEFLFPDCMSSSTRQQFLNWHKEHENHSDVPRISKLW